jgi:hypothetical protein
VIIYMDISGFYAAFFGDVADLETRPGPSLVRIVLSTIPPVTGRSNMLNPFLCVPKPETDAGVTLSRISFTPGSEKRSCTRWLTSNSDALLRVK